MLDLKYIRENAEAVQENSRNRGVEVDVGLVVELADRRSALIQELNELDPSLDLAVRIGVNTGEAVVAYGIGPQIGEAVTGDVVNTAARLQHVARWAASSSASPPSGPPTGPCATSRSRPSP